MPKPSSSSPIILLVDNGSKKSAARAQLIKLAEQLSQRTSQTIHPVSLQHADVVLYDFLKDQIQNKQTNDEKAGKPQFLLLPLFFGKSRALTTFIPDTHAALEKELGPFDLTVADTLFPLPAVGDVAVDVDGRLADIMIENIESLIASSLLSTASSSATKNIVLVDHGSPDPQITQVRNEVAKQVQAHLGTPIAQAAMERREGTQYDFNGELLEDWLLDKAKQGADGGRDENRDKNNAMVALLFALPGRHAGVGGDIENICQSVMQRYPNFKIITTPLVGEHPLLLEILADRLNAQLLLTRS